MTNISGLDVGAVTNLSKQLNTSAEQIRTLMNTLNHALNNSGQIWKGPDQARFLNEWNGTHVGQLNAVINGLTDAGRTALANANEQQRVSSAL